LFDKLEKYLADNPGGATGEQLLALVLRGPGEDVDFGRDFLRGLLADDPRFLEDGESGLWTLAENHLLEVPVGEAAFVVVDLETTGQRVEETGITEIGAVRVEKGRETGRFDQLVNPGRPIPAYVVQLTGITDAMVSGAPPIEDILQDFVDFAADAVLVAHNAAFDAALLDHLTRRVLGRPLGMPSLCTLKLARRLLPELEKTSLDALGEHFSLVADGSRHRAMADAVMTAEVLERLLPPATENGVRLLGDLLKAQEDPESDRRLKIGIARTSLESLPEGRGVFMLRGDGGEALYVGSAGNVRRHVSGLFLNITHLSDRQLQMITAAAGVDCRKTTGDVDTALVEAEYVRKNRPEFNRGDRHLPRGHYVKLTRRGPHARVLVASKIARDGELYVGPVRGRNFADSAARVLADAYDIPMHAVVDPDEEFVKRCDEAADALEAALWQDGRELRAKIAQTFGDAADKQLGVISRLQKLNKRAHWLVNAQNHVALVPAEGGSWHLLLVRAGYVRVHERVNSAAGVSKFVTACKEISPSGRRRVSPFQADASTILSHWVRRPDADEEVSFFELDDKDSQASLDAIEQELSSIIDPQR
jgi:DNA polymerase III epsilon subunit family exonuclease